MARVTGPLLSFGAAGAVAQTQVYSQWRGIQYVRRYVIPSNPKTSGQTMTRTTFAALSNMWRNAPTGLKAPWTRYAAGLKQTDRNAFIGKNIELNRGEADWSNFLASPGAGGGPPPASITPVGGALSITTAVVAPTPPLNWTITKASGVCIINQDPSEPWTAQIQYQEDLTSTYSLVFTGLEAATEYVVSAWLEYETDGERIAYSPSLVDVATTS